MTTNSCIIPTIVATLLVSVAWVIFISTVVDPQRHEAIALYEQCVMREYNMTPAQYRNATGDYPICKQ